MSRLSIIIPAAIASTLIVSAAHAQSSSLYLAPPQAPTLVRGKIVDPQRENASFLSVPLPTPRQFEVHDLITIIVRESSSASSESTLETEKETTLDGEIAKFPRFQLRDLLNLQLDQSNLESGERPAVDLGFTNEFSGEGEYERKDEMITRITARVVDIKPNGTLALEARKFIRNDQEELTIVLNGYCRAEDIAPDNTVLSTQMYDLRVEKTHEGELRKASRKGVLTRVLDAVFNF